MFNEKDHAELATLFTLPRYLGYKPDVREAPNGDTKTCAACTGSGCVAHSEYTTLPNGTKWCTHGDPGCDTCPACNGTGRVPNVDAGPAGKRFLHVALKYNPPAWAVAYLARAHFEACRVAEALAVPKAYWPMPSVGALRVLEYPSAEHRHVPESPFFCDACGLQTHTVDGAVVIDPSGVCPALAAGAGTAEHTDFDLFTIVLWRSTPADLELRQCERPPLGWWCSRGAGHEGPCAAREQATSVTRSLRAAERLSPGLHIGELGELVGLGPATPHRVPARPYVQKSLIYFAIPDHAARLPGDVQRAAGHVDGRHAAGPTVGAWLAERMARSRVQEPGRGMMGNQ